MRLGTMISKWESGDEGAAGHFLRIFRGNLTSVRHVRMDFSS